MKKLLNVIAVALVVLVLFVASIFLASEIGGEVVALQTYDAEGTAFETRLWVVEDGGHAWLPLESRTRPG